MRRIEGQVMRAACVDAVGGTPNVVEIDTPSARVGAELIRVTTAALNPTDLVGVSGIRGIPELPLVPGTEGIGITSAGQRVYFERTVAPHGSFAEVALVRPDWMYPVPAEVTDATALAAGIAGTTAWVALIWKAQLRAGETVVVLGATGAVGQTAVQVARLHGAGQVIAVGRDPEVLEKMESLGADHTIGLGEGYKAALAKAVPNGVEVIFDALFAEPLLATLPSLRSGGRVINVGMIAGRQLNLPGLLLKGRDLLCYRTNEAPRAEKAAAFTALCAAIAAGDIRIDTETLDLAHVGEAWDRQAHGPHKKLLISVAAPS